MSSKVPPTRKIIAQNRKARHNYFIVDTFEAGIALMGSEVKSLRLGRGNIEDAYAAESGGELYLINAFISEYLAAKHFSHTPTRARKLLLSRRQSNKLMGAVQKKGQTLVPLCLYFNPKGLVKVELALAEGKKTYDKRETEKERDWNRQKSRLVRERGKDV